MTAIYAVAALLVAMGAELATADAIGVGLFLEVGAVGVLVWGYVRREDGTLVAGSERLRRALVKAAVLLQFAAFLLPVAVQWVRGTGTLATVLALLLFVSMGWLAGDLLADTPRSGRRGPLAMAVVVGAIGVMWLQANPMGIDVLTFQDVGVERLLAGENPWAPGYPNVYGPEKSAIFYGPGLADGDTLNFGYPYPPLTLLLAVPGVLAGDVRLMHLLAVVLAGWLMMTAVPDSWTSRAGGVLFFTTPFVIRNVTLGYTETYMILMLAATFWLFQRRRHLGGTLMLGLFLATKQYAVLFLPVILWVQPLFITTRERMRLAWRSVAVAALLIVPGAIPGFADFMFSVVTLQLKQPFRPSSISLLALSVNLTDLPPPVLFLPIILAAVIGGTWLVLARAPRSWAGVAAGIATVQLLFLLFNKQAFGNYYLFAFAALCLAVSLRDADQAEASPGAPSPGAATPMETSPITAGAI